MRNRWFGLVRNLTMAIGLLGTCAAGAAESGRYYVNAASTVEKADGRSWQTAFASLRSALAAARAGDQIWVARGTYYPDPADRNASFQLKKEVELYGGFAGTESRLEERDWAQNPTVLSGDIGQGDKTRNTVTILIGADRAVLDGFTVTGAYSTDEARMHLVPSDITKNDMAVGGGMRNFNVAPIVRNTLFTGNFSPKGGAVYNVQDAGAATQAEFSNVTFRDNTAQIRGGAVSNDLGAMPRFINCRFTGNRSLDKGGALYNDFAASPILLNCLFENNQAVSAGAIGNDGGSSPLLVNVTITGNAASSGLGAGLYQGTGANNNPIVLNSSIDSIYNWHEDCVAVLNSQAPAKAVIDLKDFITISSLAGELTAADLANPPATATGYQAKLDGNTLFSDPLVKKLLAIYQKGGGAIDYRGAYERPRVSVKAGREIVYVTPETAGTKTGGDGSSWDRAMTDLQLAIETASLKKGAVYLKEGAYAPSGKSDRIAAFVLYDGVKLYGGFAGTESKPEERDLAKHTTILSAKDADGAYRYPHVLYGANDAVLDGLTIRDGKADGQSFQGKGGGLLAYHAGKTFAPLKKDPGTGFAMTIRNCRFTANEALEGGAIYIFAKGALTIADTVFENNRAQYGGAVLSREGNVIDYLNCVFRANLATIDGGATYEDYGVHSTFRNCLFADNRAEAHGGTIYLISRASQLEATVVKIEQCRFDRNQAPEGETLFNLDQSQVTVTGSNLDVGYRDADFKQIGGGVGYKRLGEYSVERLNTILTTERAAFAAFAIDYPPAVNAVELYQVLYSTVIPEDRNRPVRVSGLIAIPKVEAAEFPVVSYQHGTVFSRNEVPSNIEKSTETRLAVARFAGSGYIVIAADYVGKGVSGEPDGWLVREVTAQACVDMLAAAKAVAADLKVKPGKLFLSGWSQGSFSTAALMQRLEESNIPVVAAAVASSPNDIYVAVNRWIHVPSPLDVHWLVGTAAMLVQSYENYYQLPGLAAAAIKPEYLAAARDLYNNRIDWETAAKTLPTTVKELFRDDFVERNSPQASRLFLQMQFNSSYNWRFKTPVYYYYGMIDEVMTPYMVQLPVEYQKSIGGAEAQAINAGEKADHRGTFLFGLKDQLRRFEALRNGKPPSE